MNIAYSAFQTLLLALICALVIRRSLSAARQKNDTQAVTSAVSLITMNILFPLSFLEAISQASAELGNYLILMIIGFAMPAIIFILLNFAIANLSALKSSVLDIAACTMGGGNRGIALIAILTSIQFFLEDAAIITAHFYALDFGNFVFFYTIFGALLLTKKKQLKGTQLRLADYVGHQEIGHNIVRILVRAWPFLAFLPVVFSIHPISSWLSDGLALTHENRRFLLLFLTTLYVFLIVDVKEMKLRDEPALALSVLLLRSAVICIFAFLYVWPMLSMEHTTLREGITKAVQTPSFIVLTVLLMCPPSSVLPTKLQQLNFPVAVVARISSLAALSATAFVVGLAALGLLVTFFS